MAASKTSRRPTSTAPSASSLTLAASLVFLVAFPSIGCCTAGLLPRFTATIPNVTVTAGRDASLPCIVENVGDYKVAWMHLDRVMLLTIDDTTITLIPRFRVTREDATTWTLHIREVEPNDTGYYVCQVNMEPVINQVGYLHVVVPPQFDDSESSQSHVAVQESNDVRLVCRAHGVPRPTIHWAREDSRLFSTARGNKAVSRIESEELLLKGVTRKDMGAYLCIASNKVPPSISKRIVLDVHFQPLITVPNQLVGAPVATSVTLECHVSAFPNAVHFWRFNDQLLINSTGTETHEIRDGYRTIMRLSLRTLTRRDFGTYMCAAKNSLGETESNVRLYEIVMPKGVEEREKLSENQEREKTVTRPEHHSETRHSWRRPPPDLDSDTPGYTLKENNFIRNRSPGGVGGDVGTEGGTSGRTGGVNSTAHAHTPARDGVQVWMLVFLTAVQAAFLTSPRVHLI